MKKQELNDVLSNNTYPGRGICLGVDESGEYAVIVYFIMGRSVNSRNRIFEETDDGIITKAHDESLMTDPHLIIYAPVRALPGGEYTIVTNGDQTDTVYDFMQNGQTFEDALRTRTFEDDPELDAPHQRLGARRGRQSILQAVHHQVRRRRRKQRPALFL